MSGRITTLCCSVMLALTACGNGDGNTSQAGDAVPAGTVQQEPLEVTVMENGLEINVIAEGEGVEIQNGQTAEVHYTGWFYVDSAPDNRGEQFDSSRDRGRPFSFPVGGGNVIAGWDLGVLGMKIGERRILVVPSELAYGQAGHPAGIPPNSKLLFDVELLGIE